jgi:uncharacterized protein YidB (DUF937 family)
MAGYSISIGAVDGVTKVVNGINKSLEAQQKKFAQVIAPVKRLGDSFKKLSDVSGLNSITKAFAPMAAGARKAASSLVQLVAPLATITSAASIAGIGALINSWAGYGRTLNNTAVRLGTSIEKVQTLDSVGQQFGISSEAMTDGLKTLGTTLQDALMGRAPEAAADLRLLGVHIESSAYKAATGAEKIDMVRDALSKMTDPLQQAKVATDLFGAAGEAMLPYLRATPAQIAEFTAEAKKYNLTMEQTQGAASFARQQTY